MRDLGVHLASRARCANEVAAASRFPSAAPVLLVAIGCLALAVGVLVYMTDRDAARAMLFPSIASLDTGPVFGVLGPCLPSFVHPFAFSLFTAALRAPGRGPGYGACAAWWGVNVAFEVGQVPRIAELIADGLQCAGIEGPLTKPLTNYLLRGGFDVGDLIAVTLGALAAAAVLRVVHRGEVCHVP
jgi:hypothetical protein